MEGSFGWRAKAPFVFLEKDMGRKQLTLREALASSRLEEFVRQEEDHGVELAIGSDLERALALLVTQRRSVAVEGERNQAQTESRCFG